MTRRRPGRPGMLSPALLLLLLVVAGPARAADPDLPVVYGGPGPDPDTAARAARDAGQAAAEPAWFLTHDAPVVDGLHAMGAVEATGCGGEAVAAATFREAGAKAIELLDFILPDEASTAFEAAAGMIPCLDRPLPAEELARFQFLRAIAALTRTDRSPELGRLAFEAAITADPDIPWSEDYPAFPRSVFFEAKVTLLTAPRARLWVLPSPETTVLLRGAELDTGTAGVELLPGVYPAQLRRGEALWSGTLRLEPGGAAVIGDPDTAWEALARRTEDDDELARATILRDAVVEDFGGPVRVVRPGASALLDEHGLGPWTDEGAYLARVRVEAGGGWLLHERNVEAPPVDHALPADNYGLPRAAFSFQFHEAIHARLGGGLAISRRFALEDREVTRLMGFAQLGVGVEKPDGRVRPGGRVELGLLFPGSMQIGGEPEPVALAGPLGAFSLAFGLTELLWVQLEVGGGWVGSETVHAGAVIQLRPPPPVPRAPVSAAAD